MKPPCTAHLSGFLLGTNFKPSWWLVDHIYGRRNNLGRGGAQSIDNEARHPGARSFQTWEIVRKNVPKADRIRFISSLSLSLSSGLSMFSSNPSRFRRPLYPPLRYSDTRASFSFLFFFPCFWLITGIVSPFVYSSPESSLLSQNGLPASFSLRPPLHILSSPHTLWLFICANTSRPIQQPGLRALLLLSVYPPALIGRKMPAKPDVVNNITAQSGRS